MNYTELYSKLDESYKLNYLEEHTSMSLAKSIKELTVDDLIGLLVEIRDAPALTDRSLSLSRRSNLFDKLVLMKGNEPHDWVLRLHTYNMVTQSDEPGYVISNLGRKIRDDENHIHEHSWQLTSRFLMGGFRNHQYAKAEDGELFTRFNLVPTKNDGVSESKSSRKAVSEGPTKLQEVEDDLYKQGDLVHYPIEIPHKVDNSLASYLGMTITLAHTSERLNTNSIFYEKPQTEMASHTGDTLEVEAQGYTREAHRDAINMAITHLKLLKLCDDLANQGFKRFNRHIDPITKKLSPNNVLETELLPTIAMLRLQKEEFIECPMTAQLQDKSSAEISRLKEKYAQKSSALIKLINDAVEDMDQTSLGEIIKISQQNLYNKTYIASSESLSQEAFKVLKKRENTDPKNVLQRMSFFSGTQKDQPDIETSSTLKSVLG